MDTALLSTLPVRPGAPAVTAVSYFKITLTELPRCSRRELLVLTAAGAALEAAGESQRGQLSHRYLVWGLKRLSGPQTYLVLGTAGCEIGAGLRPPPPGL